MAMGVSVKNKILEVHVEQFKRGNIEALPITEKQQTAMRFLCDKKTEEVGFGGAAGGGKSWLGCLWLLLSCLAYSGTRWFIGRKELKRIKQTTYITFKKVAKTYDLVVSRDFKYNGQDNYIEFPNGSRIDFLDLKYLPADSEYERYGSAEFTGGWIEEGGEIHFGAYEVLSSRIGRHLNDEFSLVGKLLITLNPKRNWAYRLFYKPFKSGVLASFRKFIQSLVTDNKHIDKGYIEKLQRLTGSKRKRLLEGDWEYDEDNTSLFPAENIENLFHNNHIERQGDYYMTCDIALRGSDLFVIMVWQGFTVVDYATMPKSGGKEIVDLIKDRQIKFGVPQRNITYDSDGVGGFIGGKGGFLPLARPFNNGASAIKMKGAKEKENYANLKTQCIFKFSERVKANQVHFAAPLAEDKVDLLSADLSQFKEVDNDKEGKIKLVPKEQIIKILGRSPDMGETLCMREFFELHKKGRGKKLTAL